ncbi:MAG: penicillin-binding protein 1C [Gammaproteobacteria bacterium]
MTQPIKLLSITLVSILVSAWVIIFFLSRPPLLTEISFSKAVYDEHHRLLRLTLSQDDKYRLYTPLSRMSPQLVSATLLQEDQYYYWHLGVNPVAMVKAAWLTFGKQSRRIGASTISMQVARIRFHINSKTLTGKIWQILRAVQLEMHYNKKQILEAYLNLAPYGNNIEGVGAASLIYFGKPVQELTLPEALTLAVIPQNPLQRTPQRKNLREVRNKLFQRWILQHFEDQNKKLMTDLPLQMQSVHALPYSAPHFVNSVLNEAYSEQREIVTTLDSRLQKMLEHVAQRYLERKKNLGAYNSAILLVDTRDMGIKAYIGSADFFNAKIHGQINGVQIKRSPGSTLKPFIYGLALDQGLIHPNTVLKDVPHSFGSYNPENFDYDFMGPIKAKDALVLSRNIPAIYLASQLANPNLYQLLEEAQVSHLKPESYYGLALVLGGAELTMHELTSLYAMLANDGLWRPLRMRHDQPILAGKRLLSPEASFLVLDMLKNTPRAGLNYSVVTHQKIPVAWKTGTSSGYRDAWSVGVVGPYVLTVWIGNFDNVGNPEFIGKNMTAPLFFELIDAIANERGSLLRSAKLPQRLNLTQVPVCKASGLLPTRYCLDTELTWFIPGKSPIKTDTIYREVPIDKKTGLRACHFDQDTRFEIFEFWPSDLLKIFKEAGMQRRTPPSYNPNCSYANNSGFHPQITSPRLQLSYIMRANDKNLKIPLTAIADADVSTLHWFINESFVAKTRRDQVFLWQAKPGKFVVRVVDDHGRSDARDINIKIDT